MPQATTEQVGSVLTLLTDISEVMFSSIGTVVEIVMSQPLLLIPIGIVMSYSIVKLFKYIF